MADTQVHRGDISTYRYASEEYLVKRRDDLRKKLFKTTLTPGEVALQAISPGLFAGVTLTYSAWNAVGGGIKWLITKSKNPWFHDTFTIHNGSISFMADAERYGEALQTSSQNIAGLHVNGPGITVSRTIERILKDTEELGHNTGRDQLVAFLKKGESFVNSQEGKQSFFKLLEDIHTMDGQAHIGQYDVLSKAILEELAVVPPEERSRAFTKAARDAFHSLKGEIIGKGLKDNEQIINKVRRPLVFGAAAIVGVATAYRSYRNSHKQKLLDMESESTFIDRELDMRQKKKQSFTVTPDDTTSKPSYVQRLEAKRDDPVQAVSV